MTSAVDVPAAWYETTLGNIGQYVNGRGFKKSEWAKSGRMIIRIQDLTGSGRQPNYYAGACDEKHVVREGDLLVSWAATLDAFIWRGPEAVLNQHIFKVTSFIDRRLHFYAIKHVLDDIRRRAHGSGMVHVTKRNFEETRIAIPMSGDEQRRVADAIEQQLTRLEVAQRWIEQGRSKIRRLRRASYRSAIQGGLAGSATEDWKSVHLVELAPGRNGLTTGPFGSLLGKSDHRDAGVPVVGIPNILEYGLAPGGAFHVDEPTADRLARYELEAGDLIVSRSGSVGEVAVVPENYGRALMSTNLMRIRPADRSISPWLRLNLRGSPIIQRQLTDLLKGSTRPFLNLDIIRQLTIRMAPPKELSTIVGAVDRVESLAVELETQLTNELLRVRALRAAILTAAFRGQLASGSSVL